MDEAERRDADARLDAQLQQRLQSVDARIAELDGHYASLHSRLMVAERLALQLAAAMNESARIRAVEEVRHSVALELDYVIQSGRQGPLAEHLREQIAHLDRSLDILRARLIASELLHG